jgi:hypothetical protein
MARHWLATALISLTLTCILVSAACADEAISPAIKETTEQVYSTEKPNSQIYGSGLSAHLTEASVLRFQGEQDIEDHNFDEAIRKLSKSVQLDPGEPEGHLLYARAMSKKISTGKGVTPDLVTKALQEWRLLWRHDADFSEQQEAHWETRRLTHVAKILSKQEKNKQAQVATTGKTN